MIIVCKGLAASGKTTWTREWCQQHPTYRRWCKDDVRRMLYSGEYRDEDEELVCAIRDELIVACIERGYDLVIDDTNLHPKHEQRIRDVVNGRDSIRIQDFTSVPLEVCYARDDRRDPRCRVGRAVILRQYEQYITGESYAVVSENTSTANCS